MTKRGPWALHLFTLTVLLAGLSAGCRSEKLLDATGEYQTSVDRLDFGDLYPSQTSQRELDVYNRGRATLPATVTVEDEPGAVATALTAGGPFELLDTPTSLPSGGTPLRLRFVPTRPGRFQAELRVASGATIRTVQLVGTARVIPDCAPQDACHQARFDLASETCVQEVLADGTACGQGNACLLEATCQQGVCVGQTVTCDDGNACTLDVCDPLLGCQYPAAPPCPGDGVCQVGTCDPKLGCGMAPAEDGTACGALHCNAANVCIAGACVVRDPPDGFLCAEASPCQGAGRCQADVCVRPPAVPLQPSWTYESLAQPTLTQLHDFVLEPSGATSLMGFFEPPRLRQNTPAAQPADATARRCIVWNGRLACADYRMQGQVSVIDLSTGEAQWTYNLVQDRPEYGALVEPGRMFMARVASMGPDRLAALFESYPNGTDGATQCRRYFLAVLDASGKRVHAQQIQDPLLDVCNHPHPFGVASDAQGNLFLSFSSTLSDQAPLFAGSPTLLMSYSRDGVFKWKNTVQDLLGGELAVSGGLLFPERSPTAYLANTGQPLPAVTLVDGRFGRVGITDRYVIPSPLGTFSTAGTRELVAYHFNGARAWTHTLSTGDVFISDQLRLAGYHHDAAAPASTVALVFRSQEAQPALTAIDARTGVEAWTCPVRHMTDASPQLFEVVKGQLTLMEKAQTCGACDPPFANSQASFFTFAIPGLEAARVPWPGAFGGPGHDHHEDSVLPGPSQ